jgi:hypothetical protein
VGDGRFAVVSEGLDDVRVEEMDREQRGEWIDAFLEPDKAFLHDLQLQG